MTQLVPTLATLYGSPSDPLVTAYARRLSYTFYGSAGEGKSRAISDGITHPSPFEKIERRTVR